MLEQDRAERQAHNRRVGEMLDFCGKTSEESVKRTLETYDALEDYKGLVWAMHAKFLEMEARMALLEAEHARVQRELTLMRMLEERKLKAMLDS